MPQADFSSWDRATLERFARQAADENRELRENVRVLHDAWRQFVLTGGAAYIVETVDGKVVCTPVDLNP